MCFLYLQGRVNFKDQSTYDCLFKEYLEAVKEKEGLTWKHVQVAIDLFRKSKNHESNDGGNVSNDDNKADLASYSDDRRNMRDCNSEFRKRKKAVENEKSKKRKVNPSQEFIGWASKPLVEFLTSVGRDPTKFISQHEVAYIVTCYCNENKLFHPQKKKIILCDSMLHSLLGRKSLDKNKICGRLEVHFAENQIHLENEDEEEEGACDYASDHSDDDVELAPKKQRNLDSEKRSQEKVLIDVQLNRPAPIIPHNIELIYLKRSLVQELLNQPECFEAKVVGSIVKVKSDPNDIMQKNSYQLVLVTGKNFNRISYNFL